LKVQEGNTIDQWYHDSTNDQGRQVVDKIGLLNRELLWALFQVIHRNMEFQTTGEHPFQNELNYVIGQALAHPEWYFIDPQLAQALAEDFCVEEDGIPYGRLEFWYNHWHSNEAKTTNLAYQRFHNSDEYPDVG